MSLGRSAPFFQVLSMFFDEQHTLDNNLVALELLDLRLSSSIVLHLFDGFIMLNLHRRRRIPFASPPFLRWRLIFLFSFSSYTIQLRKYALTILRSRCFFGRRRRPFLLLWCLVGFALGLCNLGFLSRYKTINQGCLLSRLSLHLIRFRQIK
jgi:hypothetical protein